MRGIEADIPRTLTKRSHVLPLPGGEGGVRGKALFDSPLRPLSFKSLFLFHGKQRGTDFSRLSCCVASSYFETMQQNFSVIGCFLDPLARLQQQDPVIQPRAIVSWRPEFL